MNEAELTKVAIKLRKAYRSAFFCGVLVIMAMMAVVMLSLLGGQPVDQKAIAEGGAPLAMLMAGIAGVCHMFHSHVTAKLKSMRQAGE